jgi:hypothetical protein
MFDVGTPFAMTSAFVPLGLALLVGFPGLAPAAEVQGRSDGYNETEALEYAHLATAAYCGGPKFSRAALESWQCGPSCSSVPGLQSVRQVIGSRTDSVGFVGWLRGRCVVAFRGTTDFSGWVADLQSGWHRTLSKDGINCTSKGKDCRVGAGWSHIYTAIRKHLRGNLTAIGCYPGSRVVFTGHSLGGAVAQLAMYDLSLAGYVIEKGYFFGSPRAGNAGFAQAFVDKVGPGIVYRVTHNEDPVPHLPPELFGFIHVGTEVFYNANVSGGYDVCRSATGFENKTCANRYRNVFSLLHACLKNTKNCDHLQYMMMAKPTSMDGQTCITDAPHAMLIV